MALISAPAKAPTTTPESSSTWGSSRRPETTLSRYTSATAARAPTNAANGTAQGPAASDAMAQHLRRVTEYLISERDKKQKGPGSPRSA